MQAQRDDRLEDAAGAEGLDPVKVRGLAEFGDEDRPEPPTATAETPQASMERSSSVSPAARMRDSSTSGWRGRRRSDRPLETLLGRHVEEAVGGDRVVVAQGGDGRDHSRIECGRIVVVAHAEAEGRGQERETRRAVECGADPRAGVGPEPVDLGLERGDRTDAATPRRLEHDLGDGGADVADHVVGPGRRRLGSERLEKARSASDPPRKAPSRSVAGTGRRSERGGATAALGPVTASAP